MKPNVFCNSMFRTKTTGKADSCEKNVNNKTFLHVCQHFVTNAVIIFSLNAIRYVLYRYLTSPGSVSFSGHKTSALACRQLFWYPDHAGVADDPGGLIGIEPAAQQTDRLFE